MSYQAQRVKAPDRRQPAITEDIKAAGLDWITALRAPAIKERRRKVPRWRVRCAPQQAIGSLIPPDVCASAPVVVLEI
jgi:hypothetical protein